MRSGYTPINCVNFFRGKVSINIDGRVNVEGFFDLLGQLASRRACGEVEEGSHDINKSPPLCFDQRPTYKQIRVRILSLSFQSESLGFTIAVHNGIFWRRLV